MKYFILILAVTLAGCGFETVDRVEPGTVDRAHIERTDNFTINYDQETIPDSIGDHIEAVYLQVQACVGLPTPGGLHIQYRPIEYFPAPVAGWIMYDSRLIEIYYGDRTRYDNALRHEFVHWILFSVNAADNSNHVSEFFDKCASIGQ